MLTCLVGPDFEHYMYFTASELVKGVRGGEIGKRGEGQSLGISRSHLLPISPFLQTNTSKESPTGCGWETRATLSSRVPGSVMLMGGLWAPWESPLSLKSDSQYKT